MTAERKKLEKRQVAFDEMVKANFGESVQTLETVKHILTECDEGYACKRIHCPYDDGKSLYNGSACIRNLMRDALSCIEHLESAEHHMT